MAGETDRIQYKTFSNEVWGVGNVIQKIYRPSILSPADPLSRLKREAMALRYYPMMYPGDIFTPALISTDENSITLTQEKIIGPTFQELAVKGELHQDIAGRLLRKIHVPIKRPNYLLREDFEAQISRVWNIPHMKDLLAVAGITNVEFEVNWDEVYKLGSTRIHRDYWLPNIIMRETDRRPFVIDWEFFRPGSPFQDFITVKEWITPFGKEEAFWEGYGFVPDAVTMNEYIKLQSMRYLTHVTPETYLQEPENGLYHQQMAKLKELVV